jgi:hypothetical protein
MAADLESTLIAARQSSRELASMLRAIYHPSEEVDIAVEEEAAGTVIEAPKPTMSQLGPITESMRGASTAERSRLQRARWRTRLRALAALALLATAIPVTLTLWSRYGSIAWQTYVVPLLHPAPPPPPAPAPKVETPAPTAAAPAPAAETPTKRAKPPRRAKRQALPAPPREEPPREEAPAPAPE